MAIDTGLPPSGTQDHVYTQPGTYTVQITDEDDATRSKQVVITVPFGPVLTVQEDPADPDRRTVLVTVNNYNQGDVILNWGDGGRTTNNRGDGQEQSRHKYPQGGKFTITASDADQPSRVIRAEVTVPFTTPRPVLVITEDTGNTERMAVNVTVDNHGNGPVTVEFGDASQAVDNPGDGTTVSQHTYTQPGTYTVVATDTDQQALSVTEQVTVPFTAVLWDFTLAEDTTNTDRLGVLLTLTEPGAGKTYEVNWDGGTTWADIPAAGTATHAYPQGGTYDVVVRDKATPSDTRTHQVTVPYGTQFTVTEDDSDTTRMTARVTVPEPAEGATYEVRWESTGQFAALSGTPPTATHQYASAGDKQVTVRKTGDAASETTTTVTVPFTESVTLLTTEEGGDGTRLTARTTVTAPRQGATYEVRWEDGGQFTALPSTGVPPHSATHQYAETGTKTVTVRRADNTNVTATSQIAVPFPGPEFTLTQGATSREVTVTLPDSPDASSYDVAWTDGGTPQALTGTPPTATHSYPQSEDGTHRITVRSDPGGTPVSATQQVTTPMASAAPQTRTASARRSRTR